MPVLSLPGGVELSYLENGVASRSAVLLVPGPTDSWRSYEPILDEVSEELRVVAISLRGHGDSSKPPGAGFRIEDLASDLVPFLDAIDVERVVLTAHSGSCLIARQVALQTPGCVAGLFLEASPFTLRGDEDLTRFVNQVIGELRDPVDPGFARSFIRDTSTEVLPADLVERLVQDVLKVPVVVWRQLFQSLLAYDDTNELAGLMTPTRLIWGDEDRLIPKAMQDQLLRLLPEAGLTVYAGVGHTPRWEQPNRFAADLTRFSSRVLPPR